MGISCVVDASTGVWSPVGLSGHRRAILAGGCVPGDGYGELATTANLALDLDAAPLCVDHASHHCQAETGPLRVADVPASFEALKQARNVGFRNADALIPNDETTVVVAPGRFQGDLATSRGVLDRVFEQVRKHVGHQALVHVDARFTREREADGMAAPESLLERADQPLARRLEVDR